MPTCLTNPTNKLSIYRSAANAKGSAAEALEGKLALANEGAGVTAGLGVEPLEELGNLFTT